MSSCDSNGKLSLSVSRWRIKSIPSRCDDFFRDLHHRLCGTNLIRNPFPTSTSLFNKNSRSLSSGRGTPNQQANVFFRVLRLDSMKYSACYEIRFFLFIRFQLSAGFPPSPSSSPATSSVLRWINITWAALCNCCYSSSSTSSLVPPSRLPGVWQMCNADREHGRRDTEVRSISLV